MFCPLKKNGCVGLHKIKSDTVYEAKSSLLSVTKTVKKVGSDFDKLSIEYNDSLQL